MRLYPLPLLLCALACSTVQAARVERGTLTYDNIPEVSAEIAEKLDLYQSARQAQPLGFSPKGELLISTRFADVPQLHLVASAGADRRQLTFFHEPIGTAAFSPDPARHALVYLKDAGGNENAQLYYQRLGELPKLLTDGKSRNGSPRWSTGGRELAFTSTARDGKSFDVYVTDPEGSAPPRLVVTADPDGASWDVLDWSADDRKLLVRKSVSAEEGYLYVVDLYGAPRREVDPGPPKGGPKVSVGDAKFARDGQGVYFVSDRDGDFLKLRYAPLFGADKPTVLTPNLNWDIEDLALSRDGRYLAYVSNEGGAGKLNLLDLKNHQDLTGPKLPAPGLIGNLAFDSDGKRLAFGYAAPNHPGDAFVFSVADARLEQWTQSEAGTLDPARFVVPKLAQFPTFDRVGGGPRQEPVYLYESTAPGSHPVLLLLHGGPESQFRPDFVPWIQYVVNELGYAVAVPNVRGSSGYGKSYLALDNGMLREDAVKDVGALLSWLGMQPGIDAKKIVVYGGSYGGYLSLATMVNYSDRLKGGVDVCGIGDFVSFLTNTAPYRQNQRRAEYGDERDPDMRAYLRRISPLTSSDRITKPLLVVHGRNDPRVPIAEAEQIVNRVRARGREVWYLTAADEGHGFRKKQNVDAYLRVFAQFLTNLKQ